jgi:hypothetical protein
MMSLRNKILTIVSLIALSAGCFIGFKFLNFRLFNGQSCQVHENLLHNGDLVFRRGRSIESFAVYMADDCRKYSHVGMVVKINGKAYIVHAVPAESKNDKGFVKMETPEQFLSADKASEFAVYRSGFSYRQLNMVAQQALNFYKSKCTFDNDYDLSTEKQLYCTELVLKAFRNAGIELRGIKSSEIDFIVTRVKIILPGEFMKNDSFRKIIKY